MLFAFDLTCDFLDSSITPQGTERKLIRTLAGEDSILLLSLEISIGWVGVVCVVSTKGT